MKNCFAYRNRSLACFIRPLVITLMSTDAFLTIEVCFCALLLTHGILMHMYLFNPRHAFVFLYAS